MNGRITLLIVGSLLLLVGCGGEVPFGIEGEDPTGPGSSPAEPEMLTLGPSELCAGHDPDLTLVSFEDAELRAGVRRSLRNAPFTCRAVSEVSELNVFLVTSLVGIQNFTGLTILELDRSSITDISSLWGLASLTDLRISGGSFNDLSALSGLTSLTDLDLWGDGISDLSALSGLTGLTDLKLSFGGDGDPWDLSPLSGLTNLTALGMNWRTSVSDLSFLSGLTGLTILNIYPGSLLDDISALSGLTELTDLYLGGHSITDISALSGLTSLTDLDLGNSRIRDISALSGLTSLSEVDLGRNQHINNISSLLALNRLTYVNLDGTSVSCADMRLLVARGVTVYDGRNCIPDPCGCNGIRPTAVLPDLVVPEVLSKGGRHHPTRV